MTNKTISITCDSDNVVALNAFSKALQEMAQVNPAVGELKYNLSIDTTEATEAINAVHEALKSEYGDKFANAAITGDRNTSPVQYPTDQWVEMVHPDHNTTRMARSDAELEQCLSEGWCRMTDLAHSSYDPTATVIADTATLDSEGLPWDARIHSTNKATVADGTWRLRRKPKDMDEAQWQAEIKTVRNELEQLMAIDIGIDPASPDGDKTVELTIEPAAVFAQSVDVVLPIDEKPTNVTDAFVPVPPPVETVTIAPPVIVPPPPVTTSVEPMTFPKLMSFLTERHGKITLEQVTELVAKHGLTNIQQFSQRPELIGAFVADVKTLLGE